LVGDGAGAGCEAWLEGGGRTLHLRTYCRGAVDSLSLPLPLQPGRWHSLALVMERRALLGDRLSVCRALPCPPLTPHRRPRRHCRAAAGAR
jgi:hypothetical protein